MVLVVRSAGNQVLTLYFLHTILDSTSNLLFLFQDPAIIKALNLAPEVSPDYPATFNIIFWLMVMLVLTVWFIAHGIWNMAPSCDGILYRMTPERPKTD